MTFDVFKLRDRVVGEYRDYVESFVHIYDQTIEGFVRDKLNQGELWPDAVLQLNPAYEPGPTLGELAAKGELQWGTARFFGEDLRLYRHQEEAIRAAARGGPVITSTGTGSGKSLTYLVPIVDDVLKNQPERHSVRALVVYPMNALINSQLEALESFSKQNWPECPVRFAHYTGQVRDETRNAIIDDPPHILLTNYVMLEYMLIRPAERTLIGLTTRELDRHFFRSRERMIAGAVAPPRIDLANQELVEAHLHSVWLALLGLKLGRQMVDVLDLEDGAYPLLPELQAQLELSVGRSEDVLAVFREVIALGGAQIERAGWFSSEWLEQQARSSRAAFDRSFERWRELYRAAIEQRDTARRRIDMPRLTRAERERRSSVSARRCARSSSC